MQIQKDNLFVIYCTTPLQGNIQLKHFVHTAWSYLRYVEIYKHTLIPRILNHL